jgi:hypothetical protein
MDASDKECSGPYIAMAVICERVLQEKDDVLSLIRVVDRFFVHGTAKEMPPSVVQGNIVITMKSGFYKGKLEIKLRGATPSGKPLPEREFPVLFEGDYRGIGIVAPFQLTLDEEGLYCFDVLLEDATITRVPMRVVYQRLALAQTAVPPQI